MAQVRKQVLTALDELERIPADRLVAERREKFRRIGEIPGRFPIVP
jgi:acetyl-CoA carboxylase alpha subunit